MENAIKMEPRSVVARILLADIHHRLGGNKPEAKRLLNEVLLIAPENKDALRMLREMGL